MCGIAGVFHFKRPQPINSTALELAIKSLAHRGPNGHALKVDAEVGIAMTRLSIIDLKAPAGPIVSPTKRYSIVFNGEIFNYRELRQELVEKGYPFKTHTDTEVVLALYHFEEPNPNSLLRGMYAYAVFDHQKRVLHLSRDRMGEKPLFYSETESGIAFASEIKALKHLVPQKLTPNMTSVGHFLTLGYTVGPQTAFENVVELPPAHSMKVQNSIQMSNYWKLPLFKELEKNDYSNLDSLLDSIEEKLEDAIRYRMVSDVPVGVFLSSGIDSSLCLALANRQKKSYPIQTFTVGFQAKTKDETETAKTISHHFGAQHESIFMSEHTFKEDFSNTVFHADNLLANPAMFANYRLSAVASKSIKVALNGGGGDELFYGYPTYQADFINRSIPKFIRQMMHSMHWGANIVPVSFNGLGKHYKLKKFLEGIHFQQSKAHYWWRTILPQPERDRLLDESNRNSIIWKDTFELYEHIYETAISLDPLEINSIADLEIWWKSMGIYQADTMSMANSVELRVPMMDHPFIEFALSIPRKYKFQPFQTKPLLRMLAKRVLPYEISQLKKRGFHIPLNEWFQGPLRSFVREKLSPDRVMALNFLNYAEIEKMIDRHVRKKEDNSYKIINLMVLVEWFHHFLL